MFCGHYRWQSGWIVFSDFAGTGVFGGNAENAEDIFGARHFDPPGITSVTFSREGFTRLLTGPVIFRLQTVPGECKLYPLSVGDHVGALSTQIGSPTTAEGHSVHAETTLCDQGFTLLEVMVALFVLVVGLLGVLKLETVALCEHQCRPPALHRRARGCEPGRVHACEPWLLDLPDPSGGAVGIIGNVASVTANAPLLAGVIGAAQVCTSIATPCLPLNMAAYDLQQWAIALKKLLPNVTGRYLRDGAARELHDQHSME